MPFFSYSQSVLRIDLPTAVVADQQHLIGLPFLSHVHAGAALRHFRHYQPLCVCRFFLQKTFDIVRRDVPLEDIAIDQGGYRA